MPRPTRRIPSTTPRARTTRRKILVEATRLFARHGYHKTTTADLASAIGMTQGAIFHHFPCKEALLDAVVEGLARGFTAYATVMDSDTPAESVARVVDLMVEHFNTQPEATICLAALATEFAGTGHPVLAKIRGAYDSFVEPFRVVLAADPAIRDPRASAIAFIGAVQGVAVQGLLREGRPSLEVLAQGLLGMLGAFRDA